MNYAHPTYLAAQALAPLSEKRHQHFIAAALSFKLGADLDVTPSYRHVLSQFAMGRLTIDEVVYYLEAIATGEDVRG